MSLKSDANIEEKLVCFQKRQEFGEFCPSTQKSQKFAL